MLALTRIAIALHIALVAHAACVHSPVLDETAHLPAGLAYWQRGRTDIYTHNPPLTKALAALPVCWMHPLIDWNASNAAALTRPEFELGREFIRHNGARSFWYFTAARWACIPFTILGACTCYSWAAALYGSKAGLASALLWCFSPDILANAQLITPDVAATAVGATACHVFWKWLRNPSWKYSCSAGIWLGLAELSKFTWIILFPLWLALALAWHLTTPGQSATGGTAASCGPTVRSRAVQLVILMSIALLLINVGYRFHGTGTGLGSITFNSNALSETMTPSPGSSTALYRNIISHLPSPVPIDYLRGIDLQRVDFERQFDGYLGGEWKRGGWWYYYLYGLAVKVPLGTLALAAAASVISVGRQSFTRDEAVLLAFPAALLCLVSSQTGINMFLRYALPAQPFLFIWASKAFVAVDRHCLFTVGAWTALAWSTASSMWHYPHSGSYFNEAVGGPLGGPEHFIDANVGWGQDLLFLKQWCDSHPEAHPLGLVYFGNFDARVAGLEFFLPPRGPKSINLQCTERPEDTGPYPGWYAVDVSFTYGTNRRVLDGHGRWTPPRGHCDFSYFRRFKPVAYAGYSLYIYHLTLPEVNNVRDQLGLPPLQDAMVVSGLRRFTEER